MSDSSMNTGSDLGHALMDAMGYFVATEDVQGDPLGDVAYILVDNDGFEIPAYNEDFFFWRIYADTDVYLASSEVDKALALCLEIGLTPALAKVSGNYRAYALAYNGPMFTINGEEITANNGFRVSRTTIGYTQAEALARLALEALRAEKGDAS